MSLHFREVAKLEFSSNWNFQDFPEIARAPIGRPNVAPTGAPEDSEPNFCPNIPETKFLRNLRPDFKIFFWPKLRF